MSSRIRLTIVVLICVTSGLSLTTSDVVAQTPAYNWRDTLYVRIVDSVYIEDTRSIEFTIEAKRPNADWNNDAVMGDMDFYFNYDKSAFDAATIIPKFVSAHAAWDLSTTGTRKNLLSAETRFYAGRFQVATRVTNNTSGAGKYSFAVSDGWIQLCRVRIPMSDGNRNPGIVWDMVATGGMTAGGDPIKLVLSGDVKNNPKGTVNAKKMVVAPQWVCQGDFLYVYVEDALTSGNALKFTWRDSVANGTANTLGSYNAPATGKSPRGYDYKILGKGDTLVIPNVPHVVDKMHLICDLYDASVHDGMTVTEQVLVRDSLFGYFASGSPSTSFGMSSVIDTVWKCQGVPAQLYLYIFGTDRASITGGEFGREISVNYGFVDKDMNSQTATIKVTTSDLLKSQNTVSGLPVGTVLFSKILSIEKMGKFWVNSISTEFCSNGAGYVPFDTVYIKEVEGNIEYNLPKVSVSIGEEVALDSAVVGKKDYTLALLHDPSPLDGYVYDDGGIYKYDATSARAGVDTVVYTYKQADCEMKAFRPVEVVENYYLTMKVLLEGSYLGQDAKGRDTMNCKYAEQEMYYVQCFPRTNLQKLVSPYDKECVIEGAANITEIPTPLTVCDWVYIKLRESVNDLPTLNYVDSLSGFVLVDGSVCGVDGMPLKFKNLGNKKVFVEIHHRNHLGIMSAKAIKLPISPDNNYTIDYTNVNNVWEGNKVSLHNGRFFCVAGNVDGDNVISVGDVSMITAANGSTQYKVDIDHDYVIGLSDVKFGTDHNGEYSFIP